jgi:trimeric autotransporter adhesin
MDSVCVIIGNVIFHHRGLIRKEKNNMRRLFALAVIFLALSKMLHGQSPKIDSISPSQGPIAGGTLITIKGANFQNATLWVDKVEIVPKTLSETEIRLTTPSHDNGIVTLKIISSAGSAYGEFLYIPPKLEDLPPGYITTVVGMGFFTGFYRPATQAEIQPRGSPAYDQKGYLYIPEPMKSRVSRISPDGVLEPFAGNGSETFWDPTNIGDGGPASEASINFPRSVTTDSEGNIYITENASRIRRVDGRTGIISTIAGDGTRGFSGDGGPAIYAHINEASQITGDGKGTIFFIDFDTISSIARIRKIAPDGVISTVAGIGPPGFFGDGGPATQARFNLIMADNGSLALDPQGNLYIVDTGNNRVRRIDGDTGIIDTFFGPPNPPTILSAVAVDRVGNVYIGTNPNGIIKVSSNGQILTNYGNGAHPGFSEDGASIETTFIAGLMGLALDSAGNIVYTEAGIERVRRLNLNTGKVETLAGIGPHIIGENGPAIATTLNSMDQDLISLPNGELLIGDRMFILRKINSSGNISTFANGGFIGAGALDRDVIGNIYLADSWRIYRIDINTVVHPVAGREWECAFDGDGGLASTAGLCQPWGVALDAAGNLFIADTNNNRIRRVDARTGVITTVAGSGRVNGYEHYWEGAFCGDGGPAIQACLNTPYGVAVDSAGNLYIADTGNTRIRKVDANGIITTFAADIYTTELVFDTTGNLYTSMLNRFDPFGNRTHLAGTDSWGFSGDGGPALQAQIKPASGVAMNSEGDIFFQDSRNNRIRAIRYGSVLAPLNAQIRIIRGAPQSALTTTAFDIPLEVVVLDSSGNPAPGVRVEFSAPSSGPSCTFAYGTTIVGVVTDRTGHASAICTANAQKGTYRVTATPLTATASASFALRNTVPRASIDLALAIGSAATASTIGGNGSLQTGYASVGINSGVVPYGTAVFSFKQDGVTVTEAGVPASPPTTQARIFIDYRSDVPAMPGNLSAGTIDINTGIAVVNSGSEATNATYTLRDINGATLASGHGAIAAGAHFAKFIDQLKDVASDFALPSDFQNTIQFGSLEISGDHPLSILALRVTINQRNEALLITTPVADLTQPLRLSPIYFPQFADGGGFTTSLILLNTSDSLEEGTLRIMDDSGTPLTVNKVGGTTDSSFRYSIPSGGAFRFQTDAAPTSFKVGWVRLTPDSGNTAPIGSGVFSYNPGSILVSESGIPSAVPTTHARVYVDLSKNHNTGLAIANATDVDASITIVAFQIDGVTGIGISQGPLQLVGNGHAAKFADEFIKGLPAGFTGVMDINSTIPFAALTLRSLENERHDFLMTTFPIANANQPAPSPIVFPQIADGGGYITQFIFLSPSGESNTTISFNAEDGTPLAIGK